MNSGLPSLLDAIFGKQNLDAVSLDEIYELINEFPSFNAGHFLLSRKLKEQQESGYEKETMRTALYFNNPFWLESVLNEDNYGISGKIAPARRPETVSDFSAPDIFVEDSETPIEELTVENFASETVPLPEDESYSFQPVDGLVSEKDNRYAEEIYDPQQSVQELPRPEYTDGPVKSFDDLISKYHIEPLTTAEPLYETPTEPTEESLVEPQQGNGEQRIETIPSAEQTSFQAGHFVIAEEESEEISDDYEIREEVVNDYGIFEEVKVKKTDFDLEAFDRPVINIPENSSNAGDSVQEELTVVHLSEIELPPNEQPEESKDLTVQNAAQEASDEEQTRADYEAFDPPVVEQAPEETAKTPDLTSEEESISEIYSGQDLRLESVESSQWESDYGAPEVTASPEQHAGYDQETSSPEVLKEIHKPIAAFDPKKAESIVFAPYHMIDYFASQGIKLKLEENPADPLSRQLKSFTDWLKVMKKLPPQFIAEKAEDGEVDRIRHFAAHSIDEREILTESMAEVLAKQGMYENAIALFQKLSLIYPPKSAYFASRIEQIKASLP